MISQRPCVSAREMLGFFGLSIHLILPSAGGSVVEMGEKERSFVIADFETQG